MDSIVIKNRRHGFQIEFQYLVRHEDMFPRKLHDINDQNTSEKKFNPAEHWILPCYSIEKKSESTIGGASRIFVTSSEDDEVATALLEQLSKEAESDHWLCLVYITVSPQE